MEAVEVNMWVFQRSVTTGLLLALLMVGCQKTPKASGEKDCQKLAQARAEVEVRIQELELLSEDLPEDPVDSPEELEAKLMRFGDVFRLVNRDLNRMHTAHEPGCKAPLVEDDRFDSVYEKVYRPYIELIGRQHDAVEMLVAILEEHKESPPIVELALKYRAVAEELHQGLKGQIVVCENDFDARRCARFGEEIAAVTETQVTPPDAAAFEKEVAVVKEASEEAVEESVPEDGEELEEGYEEGVYEDEYEYEYEYVDEDEDVEGDVEYEYVDEDEELPATPDEPQEEQP